MKYNLYFLYSTYASNTALAVWGTLLQSLSALYQSSPDVPHNSSFLIRLLYQLFLSAARPASLSLLLSSCAFFRRPSIERTWNNVVYYFLFLLLLLLHSSWFLLWRYRSSLFWSFHLPQLPQLSCLYFTFVLLSPGLRWVGEYGEKHRPIDRLVLCHFSVTVLTVTGPSWPR